MVDIPVKDEHALGPTRLGCPRSHSSIVEEAKAHGHAALRMVACGVENGGISLRDLKCWGHERARLEMLGVREEGMHDPMLVTLCCSPQGGLSGGK